MTQAESDFFRAGNFHRTKLYDDTLEAKAAHKGNLNLSAYRQAVDRQYLGIVGTGQYYAKPWGNDSSNVQAVLNGPAYWKRVYYRPNMAQQFAEEDKKVTPVAPVRKKMEYLPKRAEVKRQPKKKKAPTYPLVQKPKKMPGDLAKNVVSPFTNEYRLLQKDPAFLHAQGAGILWQSLVSQHVKFPSKWWNGSRSPALGLGERRLWQYIGRHRVGGDQALNRMVYNRGAAGRVLMHIIVKEESTLAPALDVAIGCFHPNARGVRTTAAFEPALEDCRDIWLATRRRFPDDLDVENSLRYHEEKNAALGDSPLGPKHAVNNENMRAIFGEKPPLQTMFLLESELKSALTDHLANQEMPPSLVLLQRYLKLR